MRALSALLVLLPVVVACTPAAPSPAAAPRAAQAAPSATVSSATVARPTDAKVEVALAGPSRVLYSPATMRAPRPAVKVTITNPNAQPLDVTDVRVRLDVTRGSQRVRCEDPRTDEARRREPLVLGPGASSTWVRTVDCPLALAGTYVAQVVVAFGRSEPFVSGVVVKELALTVAAPPEAQPRPVAAVPGLHAAIGSGGMVLSTSGTGRIVVALVNSKNERIALPPMRIALRVRRLGTDIPCEDEPVRLELPEYLEGSAVVRRPVSVSCLGLGVSGSYDVEARLLVGEEAHAIGSLRVDVTTDPNLNRRLMP